MSTENESTGSGASDDPHHTGAGPGLSSGRSSLRLVFMGTPEFAVASLDALLTAGYSIVGVITAPDKPAGRGMQLTESAVKKYAREKGLNILQPEKLKNPQFLDELRSLHADVQVVVAFRMLPELVWNMPPLGTINLHGSLLPQYRGAAPINWAVINGEKETGVTTFRLQQDIDTGNILLQEAFPIGEEETAGEVHDRMKEIGARVLVQTIDGLAAGTLREISQEELLILHTGPAKPAPGGGGTGPRALRHAPKIFTETCKIDWNKPVAEIFNLIRGLSPFPAAFTHLDGKLLKVFRAGKENKSDTLLASATSGFTPGQYATDKKTYLKFACPDGWILLEEIQLEGKKKMNVADFLRGYKWP
ncbi:MAG TPA: methionyl-tRNA formyltransferase [Puia sp.]|nr:methionyl-tRNA formyltransferase [Puia sp.]